MHWNYEKSEYSVSKKEFTLVSGCLWGSACWVSPHWELQRNSYVCKDGISGVQQRTPLLAIVVQSLSRVQLFLTPWTATRQASLSFTISWSLLKLIPIESVMTSNHLIICRPLLLLPSIFPNIRIFSNELTLHRLAIGCHQISNAKTRIIWQKQLTFSVGFHFAKVPSPVSPDPHMDRGGSHYFIGEEAGTQSRS